jgi:hypothetical protein
MRGFETLDRRLCECALLALALLRDRRDDFGLVCFGLEAAWVPAFARLRHDHDFRWLPSSQGRLNVFPQLVQLRAMFTCTLAAEAVPTFSCASLSTGAPAGLSTTS